MWAWKIEDELEDKSRKNYKSPRLINSNGKNENGWRRRICVHNHWNRFIGSFGRTKSFEIKALTLFLLYQI